MDDVSLEEVWDWDFETLLHHAEAGLAVAQYNLGCCCELGIGLPVDMEEAHRWYDLACEAGNADAQYRMALAYLDGDFGLVPDAEKADYLLKSAAAQGFEPAMNREE